MNNSSFRSSLVTFSKPHEQNSRVAHSSVFGGFESGLQDWDLLCNMVRYSQPFTLIAKHGQPFSPLSITSSQKQKQWLEISI